MNLTGARWVAVAGVAALTIVVVVLAALALQRSRGDGDAAANPVPSFTLGVTTQSPTATPTPEASPGAQINRAEERFLTAGSEVLWRGTAGECGVTEPLVERSDDGGATWTDVTPRYLGIGQVMGMSAFSAVDVEMVAAVGPECEVQALRTYTDGEFWEPYPEVLVTSSYIDNDRSALILAGESSVAPCPAATSLSADGDTAALICAGIAWTRSGSDWTTLGLSSVIALTLVGSDVFIARADDTCEGIAVSRVPGTDPSAVQPLGCVAGTYPATPTAITNRNGDVVVWSGEVIGVLGGVV